MEVGAVEPGHEDHGGRNAKDFFHVPITSNTRKFVFPTELNMVSKEIRILYGGVQRGKIFVGLSHLLLGPQMNLIFLKAL